MTSIGADRADQLHVPGAGDAGDRRAEGLGDLHRERTHATRGAVDEDLLARLYVALVAQQLECGGGGDADRRSLLEGQVDRLHDEVILGRTGVLGEGARDPAEYLITRSEARHVRADRLDRPRDVGPGDGVLRSAQPRRHTHDEWPATHEHPVTDVEGCRMDAHQDLAVPDLRPVDVPEL